MPKGPCTLGTCPLGSRTPCSNYTGNPMPAHRATIPLTPETVPGFRTSTYLSRLPNCLRGDRPVARCVSRTRRPTERAPRGRVLPELRDDAYWLCSLAYTCAAAAADLQTLAEKAVALMAYRSAQLPVW